MPYAEIKDNLRNIHFKEHSLFSIAKVSGRVHLSLEGNDQIISDQLFMNHRMPAHLQ